MIEIILSILVIISFIGALSWILISPVKKKRTILFNASVTDNAEDADIVLKRATNGKTIDAKYK